MPSNVHFYDSTEKLYSCRKMISSNWKKTITQYNQCSNYRNYVRGPERIEGFGVPKGKGIFGCIFGRPFSPATQTQGHDM